VELSTGEKVDRYTLVKPLGKGGQATVWEVIEERDEKKTLKALKLIDLTRLPANAVERARREAGVVEKLRDHPAIVHCHDLFDLPGQDMLGLVFDLVPGTSLAYLMQDPRMTVPHRVAVLRQVGLALAHVHSCKLVHRDIKPGNVIVTEGFWNEPEQPGNVKLVDFGIVAPTADQRRITAEYHPVGTAPYLAPELLLPSQWQSAAESYTQDIFAFGVMAFELLAGGHPTGLPIRSDRLEFARVYRTFADGKKPWPVSNIQHTLGPIFHRCLVLDPNLRIASGSELAAALRLDVAPHSSPRVSSPSLPTTDPGTAATNAHNTNAYSQALPGPSLGAGYLPTPQRPAYQPPQPSYHAPQAAQTPLPAQPAPQFYAPQPSYAPPQQPQTSPSSSKPSFMLIAAGLIALGLVAFVSWQLGRSESSANGTLPTNSFPPTRSNSQTPSPAAIEAKPCCPAEGRCKSDWPCAPGDCKAPLPDRWYVLRLTGVAGKTAIDFGKPDNFSEDYAGSHPNAEVCVKRAGSSDPATCTSLKKIAASEKGAASVRVSTADLETGGLEIWVKENGTMIQRGYTGIPKDGGFLITTLCIGIRLFLGPKETSPIIIRGFLDPG